MIQRIDVIIYGENATLRDSQNRVNLLQSGQFRRVKGRFPSDLVVTSITYSMGIRESKQYSLYSVSNVSRNRLVTSFTVVAMLPEEKSKPQGE
ncbi:hypothetical protein AcW1_009537 [Taiwanofungus camphoratus]|nr:hypothetical protein AcV5_002562 [Antrodia cinnamomea]KAI0947894.1 hypothetical protein AcW1_009537 [Antrodia cinnamomea]